MKKILMPSILISLLIFSSCSAPPVKKQSSVIYSPSSNSSALSSQFNKALGYINQKDWDKATKILDKAQGIASSATERAELLFVQAIMLNNKEQPEAAIDYLNTPTNKAILTQAEASTQKQINEYLVTLYEQAKQFIKAAKQRSENAPYYHDSDDEYQKNQLALWQDLEKAPVKMLEQSASTETNKTFQAWIKLSLLVFNSKASFRQQIANISLWQQQNPTHPGAMIPPKEVTELKIAYYNAPKQIAVILPFEGKYKRVANAIRDGIMQSYFAQKTSNIRFYSSDATQDFMPVYDNAIQDGADLVIGPLLKSHLKEFNALQKAPVTTIALNQLSDDSHLPKNLVQFSLSAEDEIDSLINYAQQEKHQRALILAENADWAKNNINYFKQRWQQQGNTVVESATFTTTQSQSQIVRLLLNIDKSMRRSREIKQAIGENVDSQPRRRQDVDMVVIFAKPEQALAIPPLFNFYYASGIPIYSTSSIFKGYNNRKFNRDLNGVRITEFPLILNNKANVPEKYRDSSLIRMYAFGKDAFAVSERASALETIKNISIYGATGKLSYSGGQIHRQTQSAIFKNGLLKPASAI